MTASLLCEATPLVGSTRATRSTAAPHDILVGVSRVRGEGDIYNQLIEELGRLDEVAATVQGESELLADQQTIDELVGAYQEWYARALAVLPEELRDDFTDLYEGGLVVQRIKAFLRSPGARNVLFDPDADANLVPFWQHPYEETFHGSLLEQRQLLTVAKQLAEETVSSLHLELLVRIGRGFPELVESLQHRYGDRDPFPVADEYDVQDLIHGVLRMLFADVRPEDPSPTRAGGSSRVDFLLKREQIVVEIKMTREGMRDRDVGDQLIEDIERYRSHPDCGALVAIVYDPSRRIRNPRGVEEDLSGNRDGLAVRVVIAR